MIKILVSVYDKVANIYSAPMVEPNIDVAKRNFRFGVRQNQVIMSNPGECVDGSSPISLPGADIRIPVSDLLGIHFDSPES